ncbi:MAG: hypothetical protein ACR5LC_10710 [Symbiopectobacterium sp.]
MLNVNDERYNTLVFSHYRCNFVLPEDQISAYRLVYPAPDNLSEGRLWSE